MRRSNRFTGLVFAGLLSLSAVPQGQACAFHGYVPDPTLIDILLGTEQAVIARPDASNPDRYIAVEALLGPKSIEIPISVGEEITAQLAKTPGQTVLLARDEAYGPWLELAVLDKNYRAVIDHVLERQSDWVYDGDQERFQLFANLITAPNPRLRKLALRELDKADYSILQSLSLPRIHSLRNDLQIADRDLAPILVLLAGLSGDTSYSDLLTEGLSDALRDDLPYLGAYATALIELLGPDAVGAIVERHLLNAEAAPESLERLIEAFAIQNQTADAATRAAIRQGTSDALKHAPHLAGATARQFGIRSDWSLAEPLARARSAHPPRTIEDVFALSQYIGLAEQARQDGQ